MGVVLVKSRQELPRDPLEAIASRLAAGRTDSFLYVAPTRRKVRALQREFLSKCPGQVSGPMQLFTLETLAAAVCAILVEPKRLLSEQLRAAVIQEAIRLRARELGYFRLRGDAKRLPRGTLARIAAVINRLRASGVYLSTLMEEIGEGPASDAPKLRDIALIYDTYERLLGERGFTDPPGLFRDANLAWTKPGSGEQFRERYPAVDLLVVSGFDEFSDPELTLLNYIAETPGLATVVLFDYLPDNDDLFGHLKENYVKFLAMGFRPVPAPGRETSAFESRIARRLFVRAPGAQAGSDGPGATFDASAAVTVVSAADRSRETELAARLVKSCIADMPGLGLPDICICMPRPELYADLVREIFEQAGIPANVTDRFSLEDSSVVSGIVSLLLVAQNNFRLDDIIPASTNPFLRIGSPSDPIQAGNLLRTASELRTLSGRKRWSDRIGARLRFLQQQGRGGEANRGGAPNRVADEIARLTKAAKDLDAIDRILSDFRAPMTPPQFCAAVSALCDRAGIAGSLADAGAAAAGAADIEREARALSEFLAFVEDLPEILEFESGAGESHPLAWYIERFRPLLSQVRYNVGRRYGEGVLVTSIDETRGLNFRVKILAGLVDGEFPAVYQPEVFLTAKTRERRERYHLHGQRYLFYQALSGGSERIFLTRPLREGGVDLNPSGFLESLTAAVSVSGSGAVSGPATGPGAGLHDGPLISADEVLAHEVASGRVPADVARAIEAEDARRRGGGSDAYRGILDPAELTPRAAAGLGSWRHRAYSVTQLETYGDCPFRFFAGRMLRLRVPEPPEDGLSPRELGKILHEILYEFYADRREKGLPPIRTLDDAAFADLLEEVRALAARKFEEAMVDDVFWEISREEVLGGPAGQGALEAMLRAERDADVEAEPSWFEVRFGRAGDEATRSDTTLVSEEPVAAGGIFLQGKIDRIDVAGDVFRVIDYKTGRDIPARRDVDSGASLQLPLYLHCAEQILSGAGRTITGGAGFYYHLRPDFEATPRIGNMELLGRVLEKGRNFRLAPGRDALREQIRSAVTRADGYAERISGGVFPVEPRNPAAVCRRCNFVRICRIGVRAAAASDEDPSENPPEGPPED